MVSTELLPCPFCCKRLERSAAFSTRSQDHFTHPALDEDENPCVIENINIVVTDREHDIERVNAWNRRDFSPATIVAGVMAEIAWAASPQTNLLGTYEEILRVVCGHLELPQSESGPADDVRLYDRALEALDEYSCKADADLAENKGLRFKAEAQVVQLRKVVEELKFALFSTDMTIKDRADQSARLVLAATTEG